MDFPWDFLGFRFFRVTGICIVLPTEIASVQTLRLV